MQVTVINGSGRHGSTWNCMELILSRLSRAHDIQRTEFQLPKDMEAFCRGCYSCFLKGEHTCPHASFVAPIAQAIVQADLVILVSPVYALDVTGHMKALLDHLCYLWLSHRPDPRMFHKLGLAVATTAGAGLGHTAKTMKNSLRFWGVQRIYLFKKAVSAMSWNEVSDQKKKKIEKDADKLARKISRDYKRSNRLRNPIFRSILSTAMAGMIKKHDWNVRDRDHWKSNGWLDGKKPF